MIFVVGSSKVNRETRWVQKQSFGSQNQDSPLSNNPSRNPPTENVSYVIIGSFRWMNRVKEQKLGAVPAQWRNSITQ